MARRLLASGFRLTAFDLLLERTNSLVEFGATGADSPQGACEDAQALVLMVADAAQAEDALFGEKGAVQALTPGAAVILMSTVGRAAIRQLDDRLTARELRVLDAPVSGGVARAEEGDLLIMAGGQRDLFHELRPVLESMGSTIVYCSESPGDGQAVKLVNQLLCGVHLAAAGEALAYTRALGLDPRFVFETIRRGSANSFMLEDRGERMLTGRFDTVKSALDIFVKDMGLVLEAAEEQGFRTLLASTAHQVFAEGRSLGFGAEDDSGVVRVFDRWFGTQVSEEKRPAS